MQVKNKVMLAVAAAGITAALSITATAATVTTNITATVDSNLTITNVPTTVPYGNITPTDIQSTGDASTTNNIDFYSNEAGKGIQVVTTADKVAPAGVSVAQGHAVIAIGTPSAANATQMIPITMVCTSCNNGDALTFSPLTTADAGGIRTVTIPAGNATHAACTAVAANCTFTLGPTTGYLASKGDYTGQLQQVYTVAP